MEQWMKQNPNYWNDQNTQSINLNIKHEPTKISNKYNRIINKFNKSKN